MGDDSVDEADGQPIQPVDLEPLLTHHIERPPPGKSIMQEAMPRYARALARHRDDVECD